MNDKSLTERLRASPTSEIMLEAANHIDALTTALKKCAAVCAGETVNKNGLVDALELAMAALAQEQGK